MARLQEELAKTPRRIWGESLQSAVKVAWEAIEEGKQNKCEYAVFLNPHSLCVAAEDCEFSRAIDSAKLRFPDGVGVTLALLAQTGTSVSRITGSDFFSALTASAQEHGEIKYFFLGSSEAVLMRISARLSLEAPHVRLVGWYSPPFTDAFSDDENRRMIEKINESCADVLWVGMTAPKQEKWLAEHGKELTVPFAGAIGAVFDYYAGLVRRPAWASRLGVEWLIRLAQQPRRLWRRTFVSGPVFLFKVLTKRITLTIS